MPKKDNASTDEPTHSGVVACRVRNGTPEVLLVTATGSGNWVIPKGRIDEDVGSRKSARRAAFEEAGIKGKIDKVPFDQYTHGGEEARVEVFLMRVTSEAPSWPEEDVRERRWVPLEDSRDTVEDPGLRDVLRKAASLANPGKSGGSARSRKLRAGTIGVGIAALLITLGIVTRSSRARDISLGETAKAALALLEQPAAAKASDENALAVCQLRGKLVTLPDGLSEASGAAVSVGHPGIIWTHNDSGEPYAYAVDRGGKARGRVRLTGARVDDWESIDLGPCPSGQCLYVGDIGDNGAKRSDVVIYRVAEPAPSATSSARVEAIRAKYPDGPHDAEALFVSPDGTIHIVTKGEGEGSAVYRLSRPAAGGTTATLKLVRRLSDGKASKNERITGADMSADGRWIVLRTNGDVAFYRTRDFAGGSPAAMRMDLKSLNEPQGEGVAFGATSGSVVLISEGGKKKKPGTVAELACSLDPR
ncbi:MAG TPA: NUDIX hydrolase [Gemmatimonadaceae bacterium]|nr:NUDIX hydrolase [Gemmatimonadaceae bacterium]